jgi:hypothetical protein
MYPPSYNSSYIQYLLLTQLFGREVMVFNATFNNFSVISSVLLVEEIGVPGENHEPSASDVTNSLIEI